MHLRAACLSVSCLLACTTRNDPPHSFAWRKIGGETTDFGGDDVPVCVDRSSPIDRDQAVARGFAVDTELAKLEGVVQTELVWSEPGCASRGSCPHTVLTQTVRLESLVFHAGGVGEGFIAPASDCPNDLSYLLRVELSTADGSLSGNFVAEVRSRLGHVPGDSWNGFATAQLTDFHGSEHVLFAADRPHWSEVDVWLQLGAAIHGSIDAKVLYTDGAKPAEHPAMREAIWSSEGPAVAVGDPLPKGLDSVALDDYQGSLVPPSFDVRVTPDAELPGGQLSVSVNGEVHEFASFPEDRVLDVGKLPIGDVVSAVVTNPNGGAVGALLQIGGCSSLTQACAEPGCAAHVEATVAPQRCSPTGYYD